MAKKEKKIAQYNLWLCVESVDKRGDCIGGNEHYLPVHTGSRRTLEEIFALRDSLLGIAGV